MQVVRPMAFLLIIKLNIPGSCRLSRIIMQPLDKVSCISAIKMNEFILYCSRFALPLQCRTMARTTTTMLMARASAAITAAWRQAQARALARAAKNNFQEGDAYEKMQFYYHPDHLGCSSYITNLEDEVVQHIEYVPFGEVFVEERKNISNNPLRRQRNGKR